MKKTDLIVIGAGPGGYRAAAHAARQGLNVVIFEADHLGGTCLNKGCIPTKSFARNAEVLQTLRDADTFGLDSLSFDFQFPKVVERKDHLVETLRAGIETLLGLPNIQLVRERAAFADSHTVQATTSGEHYEAPHILVATGSVPKQLHLQHVDQAMVCSSADLLQRTSLPKKLCIVGAGVVGMEFASIFHSFGVDVTVVEFLRECLPALDADIAKRLRKQLEKRGIEFIMQAAVTDIADGSVGYERKGKSARTEADCVLMAVGRMPRVSDDFARAGFRYDPRTGIDVNEHLQTSVEHIYAIGDVNGRQMLAHAAEMQGLHAVNHLMGRTDDICLDIMPAAIFTSPEAACVGMTEEEARARGLACHCRKGFWRSNGKALAMNESEGMLKLMADDKGTLIGCHAFGAHAADLVQEVSVLMCRQATVGQLAQMVHIHPTLGEILQETAAAF